MLNAYIILYNHHRDFQYFSCLSLRTSLIAQMVKNLPATRETRVQSLGQEDPLEKEMATHSSILAWRLPWTEEPSRLKSMGSQRAGHDWATTTNLLILDSFERNYHLILKCMATHLIGSSWLVCLSILMDVSFLYPLNNIFDTDPFCCFDLEFDYFCLNSIYTT